MSEAEDPLAAESQDIQFDSDRLDLAEQQATLNKREADLYTQEQRDELAARNKRTTNERIVHSDGESRVREADAEIMQNEKLQQMQRQRVLDGEADLSEQQRQVAEQQRRLQQNEFVHSYRKNRWRQKSDELREQLEHLRSKLKARTDLSNLERNAKLQKLEEEHKVRLRSAKAVLEAEIEAERVRQDAELAKADSRFQQGLAHDDQQFSQSLNQQTQKFEQTHKQRAQSHELERQQNTDQADQERLADRREMELTLEMRERVEAMKQAEKKSDHERLLEQQDLTHRQQQEQLDKLNTLNPDAMLAAMSPEQAQLFAKLRETEALKGFTAEQILARAAEGAPEVAMAFAEKFKADGGDQTRQEVTALYERMLAQQAESGTAQLAAMKDLFAIALRSQGNIDVPATDASVATSPADSRGRQFCTNCGSPVAPVARFCSKCAQKID